MKKTLTLIVLSLLLFPVVSSLDLKVVQSEKNNIIMREIENDATFKLEITNLEDQADLFQIYSLISVVIYPKEKFTIGPGETITLDIGVVPHKETIKSNKGNYAFEYQIKGQKTGFYKDFLAIKILDAIDAIDAKIENIQLEDKTAKITIKNLEEFNFEDIQLSIESDFFDFSQTLDLSKLETKEFRAPIIKSKKLTAGLHEAKFEIKFKDAISKKDISFSYLEKEGIRVKEDISGFIIKKTTIIKTNEGNIPTLTGIETTKNILTRLFTAFSEKPKLSERRGVFVDYSWEKELEVGEEIKITISTNYTFPFILLILIIAVAITARFLASQKLSLSKRVSPVKTKGGELALKITLKVKTKKPASSIFITDTIPRIAKLYEKFGIKPHKIDHEKRKLHWEIKHLSPGEQRIFTYIIYSKINIVGNFELPLAHASYEIDGQKEHVYSNKTSFVADTNE